MSFYQIVLPVFTIVFLLQVFVIQSWLQWKKTGVKPYVFGHSDSPHDYCGKVYKFLIVGTWISIFCYSFFYSFYKFLLPFWYLEYNWVQHIGFGLALISFIWIVVAQKQMATSWRIGINYNEKTTLMKQGVFNVSRNPIFLGVMMSYIGTFLIVPNALSLSVMALTFVVLQIQIRLEEEYLKNVHGSIYAEYCDSVSRWF